MRQPQVIHLPQRTILTRKERLHYRKGLSITKIWKKAREKRPFTQLRAQRPVRLRPGVYAVERRFPSLERMKEHIHRVRKINFLAKKAHFQTFDFQPHQILVLDTHHLRLLEQVHPGLDFHQITNFRSTLRKGTLFGKLFLRRLNEKGITIGELRTILFDCAHEIQDFCATLMEKHTISFDEGLDFDNVVVVDFNPKTRKPTLAFVDHGGSHQTIGKR